MGMGCGITVIKYILFVFNLVCALCGIAILVAGVMALLKVGDIHVADAEMSQIYVSAVLLIVLGSIIFVIAFFGCCGAIYESRCMTSMYSSFLMMLLIAQIVFGVMLFMNQDEVRKGMDQLVRKMWQERQNNMQFWDKVQPALQCCGLNSPIDWVPNTPPSCCPPGAEVAGVQVCLFANAYQTGCAAAFRDLSTHAGPLAYFILGVAGIELIGVIFACCLANSIRNQERRSAF